MEESFGSDTGMSESRLLVLQTERFAEEYLIRSNRGTDGRGRASGQDWWELKGQWSHIQCTSDKAKSKIKPGCNNQGRQIQLPRNPLGWHVLPWVTDQKEILCVILQLHTKPKMRWGSWKAWHETATLVQGELHRPSAERIINRSLCCHATSFIIMIE